MKMNLDKEDLYSWEITDETQNELQDKLVSLPHRVETDKTSQHVSEDLSDRWQQAFDFVENQSEYKNTEVLPMPKQTEII